MNEGLNPYHVQKVQALIPADYAPRVAFAPNIKAGIWFQHDEAPPHFSFDVRSALDATLSNSCGRWIGRVGTTDWPVCSPGSFPSGHLLWGHLKTLVYEIQKDLTRPSC
ncbi:hypothetical protein AVEN_166067-1 [Araneus ventricosus]|uniref:Uncharacterized protein n=1 Tax=Araneus ventricosus TaxID=182803 RepID=A0A4Y2Q0Q2_ARAVE|nr:hypothetical protein AVEN_166067-1 [Araneus ventricosus]